MEKLESSWKEISTCIYTNKKEFQDTVISEKSKLQNNIYSEILKNTQSHTIYTRTIIYIDVYLKEGLEGYTPYW